MTTMPKQNSPLRRDGFTFRQFFAAHDRCAMKVGTDSVLLGAWVPLDGARRALDIGTGCGLLALMAAQRTDAGTHIDAVELDKAAAAQAGENFAASPWPARLRIVQDDIADFVPILRHVDEPLKSGGSSMLRGVYNVIVANPPYFPIGPATRSLERDRARYTSALTHRRLLEAAWRLITPDGLFALVLPQRIGEDVIAMALAQGWRLRYRTDVADNPHKPCNRVLLAFSPTPGKLTRDTLILRDEDGRYSADFRRLTDAFYLPRDA